MTIPNTTNVADLGRQHGACLESLDWARRNCRDAREIWDKADADKLIWIALRPGVLTDQQLRQFAERALIETPPPEKDVARIRACIDGTDGLTYPDECTRERWAAAAIVARGQISDEKPDAARARHERILRAICPQPFAKGGGNDDR